MKKKKNINESLNNESLTKLNKIIKEAEGSPLHMSAKYKGVKNSDQTETMLNEQLVSEMKLTLRNYQGGGNSFRRGKLMLFEILSSMNEFKERVK